jgi:hypothetical protein
MKTPALFILLAAALPLAAQQKVSERVSLASGDVVPATDILPIVDISAGSAGSKKITIDELFTGWGFTAAGKSVATGADASAQRTTLGLAIGTNVQAWDADLDSWAAKTAPTGTAVGTSDTQTLTNKTIGSGTVMTLGSDGTGDVYYRASGGALTRLAAGTDGHVLTLASGLPSWAASGGGGTLTNWSEAANSSAPNATVPVVSFTATNGATNVDAAFLPKGTGAIIAAVPDSTSTGGNKRGIRSTDFQRSRTAAAQVASGSDSAIIGGQDNTASGGNSGIVSGASNTASGNYCFVGGGQLNSSGGSGHGGILGGISNTVTGSGAAIAAGNSNTASGQYSFVAAGNGSVASGINSVSTGRLATTRGLTGARAHASGSFTGTAGTTQAGTYVLRISTTNATPTEASTDGAALGAANRIALGNDFVYKFKGHAVAREPATGDVKTWDFSGTIKRGANAAATAIVGSVTMTVKDADAGASAWTLAIDADTTNGSLRTTVTGEAAKTIRWLAEVETLELQ